MGQLKDGDQVYGLDGKPCTIVKAHDIMYNRKCFEVEFDSIKNQFHINYWRNNWGRNCFKNVELTVSLL